MANHSAANLVYPLAEALLETGIQPDLRRKVYRHIIVALKSEDYYDYPDLFKLDDVLQEVIFEIEGDTWDEYYTIDTSNIKTAKRKGWGYYVFPDDPDY